MNPWRDIVFDPVLPVGWLALIGATLMALTLWVYFDVGARLGWWRNTLLAAGRLVAIALVLIALLQPSRRDTLSAHTTDSVVLVGIDGSRSMRQTDAGRATTRLQAARDIVRDSGLLSAHDTLAARFFTFGPDAAPLAPAALDTLAADGETTRFDRSVKTMLTSVGRREMARALVLLTDGHDLERAGPARTAFAARSLRVPIYAVALGARGKVRDASVSITNYQPYCFVKQRAHLTASVRLIGCEHETLTVQLLRQNQIVKTSEINAGEQSELPIDFEVSEADPGQYQYEIRIVPLPQETDVKNNSTLTFLNVIDQQISVLLLEGAPYWDTSFLERSLFANDKVTLDAVLQYMPDRARRIRKLPDAGELKIPQTRAEFERYDVVVLGRSVEKLLTPAGLTALREYVHDHGGAVVFGRGQAYTPADDLDPVTWGDAAQSDVRLGAGRDGSSLPALKALSADEALPPLIAARRITERKTLAAILAEARNPDGGEALPAMIHRRYGRGQILSVAVEGLWKWSFNPKTTATNNAFDRFWDQLLVWLVAGGDFSPNRQFAFRANTANLILGEKIHLRLVAKDATKIAREAPVTIFADDQPVARTSLAAEGDNTAGLHAEYVPPRTGLYRAVATLPDGKTQEVRWMVYDDNPEEKEVATDTPYLRALCEGSGGRVLAPDELPKLIETLQKPTADLKPKERTTSVWDRAWVFYVACFALAIDWYLRRKWGLC